MFVYSRQCPAHPVHVAYGSSDFESVIPCNGSPALTAKAVQWRYHSTTHPSSPLMVSIRSPLLAWYTREPDELEEENRTLIVRILTRPRFYSILQTLSISASSLLSVTLGDPTKTFQASRLQHSERI